MLVFPLQPIHKFPHAGKNLVPVINDAVHIADKAGFVPKLFHMFSLFSCAAAAALVLKCFPLHYNTRMFLCVPVMENSTHSEMFTA